MAAVNPNAMLQWKGFDLTALYTYNTQEVLQWLYQIVLTPEVFKVPGGKAAGGVLSNIYQYIKHLSLPDGKGMSLLPKATRTDPATGATITGPDPKPPQHISRRRDQWKGGVFPLVVQRMPPTTDTEGTEGKFPGNWDRQTNPRPLNERYTTLTSLDYWSPYDLLGLFLSLLGPAPDGANVNNFYLPLIAVYGMWCTQLGGNSAAASKHRVPEFIAPRGHNTDGYGDFPYMFTCTWVNKRSGSRNDCFLLGASMAGVDDKDPPTWRTVVSLARYEIVQKMIEGIPRQPKWDFDSSPSINGKKRDGGNKDGVRFGNCAETYNFRMLMSGFQSTTFPRSDSGSNWVVKGLAMQRTFLNVNSPAVTLNRTKLKEVEVDPDTGRKSYKHLRACCLNCREVLASLHGVLNNFLPEKHFGQP